MHISLFQHRIVRILIAFTLVLLHTWVWFMTWRAISLPVVGVTRTSGRLDPGFLVQYWMFIVSFLLIIGAWRPWSWKVFAILLLGIGVCWLLMIRLSVP